MNKSTKKKKKEKKRTILFIKENILAYTLCVFNYGRGMFRALSTFHKDTRLLKAPCSRP